MKIMKTKAVVDTHGFLTLPAIPAGLTPGEQVDVVLASQGEESAPLLFLTQTGIEVAMPLYALADADALDADEEPDDEDGLNLPVELLEDAGISADSDLEIICGDGAIVILASDILYQLPEELTGLFQELGVHPDTVREVMRKEGYLV
ncbi:hypothetical protein [Clostridium sp. HBUAS56010]|uniref:hypothetical protein n=1 Tax=Clostridium sp. HBUAS56010 TaxID=2571127 RepID=UPI0011785481|nr:hypothetical protein [Clostridium sp. HBUAS56010]